MSPLATQPGNDAADEEGLSLPKLPSMINAGDGKDDA